MILGRNLGISLPKNKKVTIKREKRRATKTGEYFYSITTNKKPVSRIHKEFLQMSKKLNSMCARDSKRTQNRRYPCGQQKYERYSVSCIIRETQNTTIGYNYHQKV